MSRETLNPAFEQVIEAAGRAVAGMGFRRRGALLKTFGKGCAGLIGFQKGAASSADRILFTVNLAVVCEALLEPDQPLKTATVWDGHLRERIGMLMPQRADHWWEITEGVDAQALARRGDQPG